MPHDVYSIQARFKDFLNGAMTGQEQRWEKKFPNAEKLHFQRVTSIYVRNLSVVFPRQTNGYDCGVRKDLQPEC